MHGFRRKSTPKVVDGRVQRKNRWGESRRVTHIDAIEIEVEKPLDGYRHYVTEDDVRQFLRLLPRWNEIAVGLDRVLLASGADDCDGWHTPGTVALSAFPKPDDENTIYQPVFVEQHAHVLDRLNVLCEPFSDDEGSWMRVSWTRPGIRGYLLMHVLLHELGHHHDRMTSRFQGGAGRGESYAEDYANQMAATLWDTYFHAFR